MQEIIQKVIATETNAKQLVQAARTEAEQVVASARTQARRLVEDAQREARLETEKTVAAAEAAAANEKTEQLARGARAIETSICLDEATVQQVVAAGLRCLCGGPQATGKAP